MSDNEPNGQSATDLQRGSEEQPADSDQPSAQSDDQSAEETDQSTEQSAQEPIDSDQRTDQEEEQSTEGEQSADQSATEDQGEQEQSTDSDQPAGQAEQQPADSDQPTDQPVTHANADNILAFADGDASPPAGGGSATQISTLNIRIRMDDRVLSEPGKAKIILPTELQNLLVQQVAASFKPLQDGSLSVSVGWGKFTDAELETPGNIEVVLTPGWGDTFTPALEVAKRHKVISTAGAEKFASQAHNAGGVHFHESDVPRDILLGPIVVTVPHIFRDRVIQWSRKSATGYDKAPAEMTIAYLGKGAAHEVGHNLGLSDILNDIDPGSANIAGKDDKWPSERPNIMDILPLPNVKPYEESMDWDEGPKSEVETRRQEAIDAIRGPVVLPKKYVDHFPGTSERLRPFSWTDPERGDDGTVRWWPSYEKFEFTNEQINNMRSFRRSVQ
jgi:hypothetical protein